MHENQGKFFEFNFSDGEVTVGRLLLVDKAHNEFIYEMRSTNCPTRYANRLGTYSAAFSELNNVRLLDIVEEKA
jgi:hypothetical protein